MPAHCAWAPGDLEGKQVFVTWVRPNFWESRLMLERGSGLHYRQTHTCPVPWLPQHLHTVHVSYESVEQVSWAEVCFQMRVSLHAPPGWLLPLGVWTGWKEKAGLMEAWAGAGVMLGTWWASVPRVIFED